MPIYIDKTTEGLGNISLRDYFAAQALMGLLAYPEDGCVESYEEIRSRIVETAYEYADEMLKQREK